MRFYIHKLGCPKNDVDADYIAARLIDEGHEPVANAESADSIIVNTCGFILPARQESIDEILRLGQLKKNGKLQSLYASGCLTQRHGDELLKGIPELDGAFGHGALDSIAKAVSGSKKLDRVVRRETRKLGFLNWHHRFISDDLPFAYLKISDGCDRPCTYCSIPKMRGRFRSRQIDSIVREAEFLAANGKKELILVSQEATIYGQGLKGDTNIIALLQELEKLEGVEWIRLLYLYPSAVDTSLIDYLAADNKALPYFDLPLQHVNNRILERMKRPMDRVRVERLVNTIRERCPEAVLRTTFILGFPGATEDDFSELMEFTEKTQFDRLGVFAYSPEADTAAESMPDQIDEDIKHRRVDDLMNLQRDIAFDKNERLVGSIVRVLIDEVNADATARGRSRADCPDIDQEIIATGGRLQRGQFIDVHIERADGYDLFGRQVDVN